MQLHNLLQLLEQTVDEYFKQSAWKALPAIFVGSDSSIPRGYDLVQLEQKDLKYQITTDPKEIKSFIKLSSTESVTIETMVLAPVALSFLFFKYAVQDQENHTAIWSDLLLLMVSGLITGGPLILFAFATQNISYATVGILQYINPTLQFLVATFILLEPFNTWHAFALVFIWIGIIIYSGESWRLELRR